MMLSKTPYSRDNQWFSDQGHLQAREDIYPFVFRKPKESLSYPQLNDAQKRDYDMGIDRTIHVRAECLKEPLAFSIQERFRRPCHAKYRDITITEFNCNSGLPSELYKIEASLMLYGYFDPDTHRFLEAIVFRVPIFKEYVVDGSLAFDVKCNSRSNQTFYCFKFDDFLRQPGLVKFHKKWA